MHQRQMREKEREGEGERRGHDRGRPRLPQRSRRPRVNEISIEFVRAPARPPPSRLGKVERKAKKARKNKKLARVQRNVLRGVFTLSFEKTRVWRERERANVRQWGRRQEPGWAGSHSEDTTIHPSNSLISSMEFALKLWGGAEQPAVPPACVRFLLRPFSCLALEFGRRTTSTGEDTRLT